jgi:dolichol-phosphate mannosyltransferase
MAAEEPRSTPLPPASAAAEEPPPDLTVLVPGLNEGPNLQVLVPRLVGVLKELGVRYEVLVVTNAGDAEARRACPQPGCTVLEQREPGYGGALQTGFRAARGAYIATMDADLSHDPSFLRDLWAQRQSAEVVIASRWVPGGRADMPLVRKLLSRQLNRFFARGLSVAVRDLSSGYRLYRADILRRHVYAARDFDILQEILVRLYADGWRVKEVAFQYAPRRHGTSNARVLAFGVAYLRTFRSLWALRNSIDSADYDDRAHDSVLPPQRYWQRQRYRHVRDLVRLGEKVLDVGCGSSRILAGLPPGSVGVDILIRKLRYARKFDRPLVQASGGQLPFADGSFSCVLSSQVIEHVPRSLPILSELDRVLAPGGRLVLGTPDYARWEWVLIEKAYARVAPGAYAHEHITHYTRAELVARFESWGYELEAVRYIVRAEMILAFRKR